MAEAGNLFNRSHFPQGVDNLDSPIPEERTFQRHIDGSMLSSNPIQPEASSTRTQMMYHPSVGHLRASHVSHHPTESTGGKLSSHGLLPLLSIGGGFVILAMIFMNK